MSTKHTLTLLVIAILLGVAALWYSRSEQRMLESAAPVTRPVFSGLTSATMERVEIEVPASPRVTLSKLDGVWYTNLEKKHKADPNLVGSLMATLEKEVTGEVVSDNPEHYADYEVTETSATRVRVLGREGKVLLDLYVGKAGSSFFTTFVRKANEKEVLSANASLTYVFNKPEGWREKKVFDFAIDDIVEVTGELTSGALALKKEHGSWQLYAPLRRAAVATKVQPFLSSIANLRATAFAELDATHTLASFGLDPPKEKLVVSYEDKSTSPPKVRQVTLLLGEPKEENGIPYRYAKCVDREDVIKLTEYQGKMLSPDPKDFAQPEETAPSSGSTETTQTASGAPATSPSFIEGTTTSRTESPARDAHTTATDRSTTGAK